MVDTKAKAALDAGDFLEEGVYEIPSEAGRTARRLMVEAVHFLGKDFGGSFGTSGVLGNIPFRSVFSSITVATADGAPSGTVEVKAIADENGEVTEFTSSVQVSDAGTYSIPTQPFKLVNVAQRVEVKLTGFEGLKFGDLTVRAAYTVAEKNI